MFSTIRSWIYISGFQTISQELSQGKERIEAVLQKMFSNTTADGNVDVEKLTTAYHKYKRKYVKPLSFAPNEENLSKYMDYGWD